MQPTLTYRGRLASNGDRKEKHRVRQVFHPQLCRAWSLPPLNEYRHLIGQNCGLYTDMRIGAYESFNRNTSGLRKVGPFTFAPLISKTAALIGKLSIVMLRLNPVGHIVHGGDIDNRLKTLLDALCVPPDQNQLDGLAPQAEEEPFFCLFDDDSLIKSVVVDTDVWLEPCDPKEVLLLIKTDVIISRLDWHNIGLG
jgi:hypothetical protein